MKVMIQDTIIKCHNKKLINSGETVEITTYMCIMLANLLTDFVNLVR